MSRCAIPGCADPCRSRQLMCKWHWKKVPGDLKARVSAAWAEVSLGSCAARLHERLSVIREYRAVRDAAVAFVCKLEGLDVIAGE